MTDRGFESFVHQPLDLKNRTIRVIQLQPTHKNSPISCTLKHIDLEDNGHVCLSYAWGVPQATQRIFINGKVFMVGENLHAFLTQANEMQMRDWLWIDAICINQANTEERNHQVRFMAGIYSLAKHVLIYLGPFALRLSTMSKLAQIKGKIGNLRFAWRTYWALERRFLPDRELDQFEGLPYWRRMWIVQEVVLAKRRLIVSNGVLLDFRLVQTMFDGRDLGDSDPDFWKPLNVIIAQANLFNQVGGPVKQDIFSLLNNFSRNGCGDRRDRVFALLGLVAGGADFRVDYSLKEQKLAFSVLKSFGQRIDSPEKLGICATALGYALKVHLLPLCHMCYNAHHIATMPEGAGPATSQVDLQSDDRLRTKQFVVVTEIWRDMPRIAYINGARPAPEGVATERVPLTENREEDPSDSRSLGSWSRPQKEPRRVCYCCPHVLLTSARFEGIAFESLEDDSFLVKINLCDFI